MSFLNIKALRSSSRAAIWVLILLYVWYLPSAIVIFDYLLEQLSFSLARFVPIVVLGALSIAYLVSAWWRGEGFFVSTFILPAVLITALVVLLQPNPIKHIHIPEYGALAILVFLALKPIGNLSFSYITVFLSVVLFGVFDEVHQGIDATRYFGWKDIVVNAAGALMGVLLIRTFAVAKIRRTQEANTLVHETAASVLVLVFMFLSSVSSICVAVFELLIVQNTNGFTSIYSVWLLHLNGVFLLLIIPLVVCWRSSMLRISGLVSSLRLPLCIASLVHGSIVVAVLSGLQFK